MKKNTVYLIEWFIEGQARSGLYTWNGKGIETSKDQYIVLKRDRDGKKTAPISVSSLEGNVYSVKGKDIDLSSMKVK